MQPKRAARKTYKPRKRARLVSPRECFVAWQAARREEGWEPGVVATFTYNRGTRAGLERTGTFVDYLELKDGPGMRT